MFLTGLQRGINTPRQDSVLVVNTDVRESYE